VGTLEGWAHLALAAATLITSIATLIGVILSRRRVEAVRRDLSGRLEPIARAVRENGPAAPPPAAPPPAAPPPAAPPPAAP